MFHSENRGLIQEEHRYRRLTLHPKQKQTHGPFHLAPRAAHWDLSASQDQPASYALEAAFSTVLTSTDQLQSAHIESVLLPSKSLKGAQV